MEYTTLNIEQKNAYVIISLNRPEALNALSVELLKDLGQAMTSIKEDSSVRGVIITALVKKPLQQGQTLKSYTNLIALLDKHIQSEVRLSSL